MNEPKFTIYRLRIESFMAGVPASESESEMIAEFILKHLNDITFLDGNGEKTTTYGAAVLDDFAYVTIEKKKNMTRDKKDCRDKEIVPTYPDFSLVLDARGGCVISLWRTLFVFSPFSRYGTEKIVFIYNKAQTFTSSGFAFPQKICIFAENFFKYGKFR